MRIGDVVPSLGLKLQNHINTNFGLELTISPEATIAGPSVALLPYIRHHYHPLRNHKFAARRTSS